MGMLESQGQSSGALWSGMFGLAGQAIQSGVNYAINQENIKASKELSAEDRSENYMYGEKAADAADSRTRALYNDFYSPEALVRQYNAAGLSPGLMVSGTPGQGGHAGAQGSGAAGVQTQFVPYAPVSLLEAAQSAALFAQAKKTEKEAEVVQPLSESEISKNLADAGHKQAAKAALEAQTAGQELQNYITEHTADASIYQICELAEQAAHKSEIMYQEMRSAKVTADLDEQLFDTNLEKGKKDLEKLSASILNTKANTRLTDEQRRAVKVDMLNSIDEIQQKWKALDIEEKKTTSYTDWINAQLPYVEKQLELKLKELGVAQWRLVVDGVTNTIKAIAIGAGAAAAFKGPGTVPSYQNSTLTIM